MTQTQPARGMRDFLPEDVRRREHVIGVIRGVYERYGFEPLETPAVENIETLLGKYGEEGNRLIFKILRRGEHEASGGADLALRYDLTVPLARVVAEYQGRLPRLFKRYQVQPVWRADRPARGRFREFWQCDVDALGTTSLIAEAEVCAAVSDALHALGFREFAIRVNHRQLLAAVLDSAGLAPAQHADALVALDKLDKVGAEGVAREFEARGLDRERGTRLLELFQASADDDEGRLAQLAAFVGDHESGGRAVADLRELLQLSRSTAAAGHMRLDPSLARGLSYYTGAIMEIAVRDLSGSLGGGGRYDQLVGMFLGRDVPACGFSLGLERIIVVMTERGMFPDTLRARAADALVTLWSRGSAADALALAGDLRAAGLRVDVYPDADKLGRQFKYAGSTGVPFVLVVGDDERARREVTIKDLVTGTQVSIPRADAAGWLRERLQGDAMTARDRPAAAS
jgi:histidyl-tRNA synthetase